MEEALIWDCDGVLVDSEGLSTAAWQAVLLRRGVGATSADLEGFTGRSDDAVLQHYRRLTGDPLAGILEEREAEFERRARGTLGTFPGLRELLDRLRGQGRRMAVASSGRLHRIRFSLAETGLDGYFDTVCSATEVERGKPAPDLFLLAARRLGVAPPRCVVIEDSVPGLQAAGRAGMRGLGFTSSHPADVLVEAGAAEVFDDYCGLEALLG